MRSRASYQILSGGNIQAPIVGCRGFYRKMDTTVSFVNSDESLSRKYGEFERIDRSPCTRLVFYCAGVVAFCKHDGIMLCSKQYFAGSVYVIPVVGSAHGHGFGPKKAGFD